MTEIEFLGGWFEASLIHPWLSHPLNIFPRLRTMTFGVYESRGVYDIHLNLLLPNGLPGVRCIKVVWHVYVPDYLPKPTGKASLFRICAPVAELYQCQTLRGKK